MGIWIAALAILTLAGACSGPAGYRVLSFFFDGVPRPGESAARRSAFGLGSTAQTPDESEVGASRRKPVFVHAPYREKRCRACHDLDSGLLTKTAGEGLCQTCHADVPGPVVYVHGPIAVNECLACHNPHKSEYPRLLRDDPQTVCCGCHKKTDLTTGAHHDSVEQHSCSECHAAHGGRDRFFLKQ